MSGPIRAPLTVETEDGSVEGRPITTIKVSNGDLTISGNVASIDTTGSGSVPGGSDTEIQYNNAGAFGGDAGLKITTKGGGSTTTIQSGNVLLGGNKLATGIANGSLFLTTDGTGQVYIQSGTDQGGTFTDTQVNIKSNTNTDNAILNFGDSSNPTNGRITLKDDGNLEIKNSVSGKNVFLEVAGSAGVTVKQGTTDTDVQLTVEGNGTGTPKISLTNSTKAVTMLCDVNQKLKIEGGTDSFVFDVSSGTGGITFPDGTTQSTAASGVSFPLTAPDGSKTAPSYSFSNDTDTGFFLVSASNLGVAVFGERQIKFKPNELQLDGGGPSQYKITTDNANTNILIEPNTGAASVEVEAGGASQNVKISGNGGGSVQFNGAYTFPTSDGSANQVLQTNGSGTLSFGAVSTDSEMPNSLGTTMTGTFPSSEHLGVGYNGTHWNNAPLNTSWANALTRIRPHVMQQTGTLGKCKIWVAALPTGSSSQSYEIGLWNAGTNNTAGTLKCTASFTVPTAGSTGIYEASWSAEAGENLDIEIGEVYWCGFFGSYGSSSEAAQLYFFQGGSMSSYPARRTDNNTASTSDMGRFYPTATGAPSTVGDNPTINNADGASAQWPIMWYELD